MNNLEIIETLDGSGTLYNPEIGEHYHSTFGAIQESKHIFIEAGLNYVRLTELNILEIGFGTGLNAYLTLLGNLDNHKVIHYFALEKFPVQPDILEKLNYPKLLESNERAIFHHLHSGIWNELSQCTMNFSLQKFSCDLLDFDFNTIPKIDLVYFDAFSPEKQPELWSKFIFEKLVKQMNPGGVLVTYCAKGSIRRLLTEVGFEVSRIPGPPGKRQILRAIRP